MSPVEETAEPTQESPPATPDQEDVSALPDFIAATLTAQLEQSSAEKTLATPVEKLPAQVEEEEAETLVCDNCGTAIPLGKHFCPDCLAPASIAVPAGQQGQETSKEVPLVIPVERGYVGEVICGNCALVLPPEARFCPECGLPREVGLTVLPTGAEMAASEPEPSKEKTTAATTQALPPKESPPPRKRIATTITPAARPAQRPVPGKTITPLPLARADERESLLKEARQAFSLSVGAVVITILSAGLLTIVGVGLALFSIWKGRKLAQSSDPDVSREGRKAFIAGCAVLIFGGIVMLIRSCMT
jgi:RNA polymerase subunit RPABC4/transcription elongation factor Spt4